MRFELPKDLQTRLKHMTTSTRKAVAVFVNGALLCPDQPDDEGDYDLVPEALVFHDDKIGDGDLLTVTNFRTFRWVHQHGHWHRL